MRVKVRKRFLDAGGGARTWRVPGTEFDMSEGRFAEIEAGLPGYVEAVGKAPEKAPEKAPGKTSKAADVPGTESTKAEIRAWAEAHGIALDGKMTKAQMLAEIESDDDNK